MKHIITSLLLVIGGMQLGAQGIDFFQGTWEEALQKARVEKKVIFVDAYAIWCGPCKRMANNVFTHPRVGEFYNSNFINLKLDMEQEEGLSFRQQYPVQAFPTLYYIDYTGEVVQQVRGAQQVDGFIQLGQNALGQIDRSAEFVESYESGNRDPELVYAYVESLNQAGKPSLSISNEYLRSQEDLESPENLKFILEATVEADSRIFDMLIEYRKQVEAVTSVDEVNERIFFACTNTAQKAADYKMESLLEDAQSAMKDHFPEAAPDFILETSLEYYLARRDAKEFLKSTKVFAKKKDLNVTELYQLSYDLKTYFPDDEKSLKQAEQFAAAACKKSDNYTYYLHYAMILHENGKTSKAIEIGNQALDLAKVDGRGAVMQVEKFLERLSG